MGCDVHTFTEVKHKNKWVLHQVGNVDRNYDMFERMAGVRGETNKAIAPPRGLPLDISDGTRLHYEYEKPDAHSESYLTWLEFNQLMKEFRDDNVFLEGQFGWLFNDGYSREDWDEKISKPPIDDVRVVFWFYN